MPQSAEASHESLFAHDRGMGIAVLIAVFVMTAVNCHPVHDWALKQH